MANRVVLVAGSHNFKNIELLFNKLDEQVAEYGPIRLIVGDRLSGVDYWVKKWAWLRRSEFRMYRADYENHGPSKARELRNQQMIDEEDPDVVLIFHNGWSVDGLDVAMRADAAFIKVVEYK
jgi:hypothetical protein